MFRIDEIDLAVRSPQHFHEKEAERGDTAADRFHGEFAIVDQMELILP